MSEDFQNTIKKSIDEVMEKFKVTVEQELKSLQKCYPISELVLGDGPIPHDLKMKVIKHFRIEGNLDGRIIHQQWIVRKKDWDESCKRVIVPRKR